MKNYRLRMISRNLKNDHSTEATIMATTACNSGIVTFLENRSIPAKLSHRKGFRASIFAILTLVLCGCPQVSAQVPVALSPVSKMQFFNQNGTPLAGGRVCTYAAGTNTPQATYTDSTGTSVNSNPIILDSAGRANIWLSGSSYKIVVMAAGSCASPSGLQWTTDNVQIGVFPSGNNVFSGNNTFNGTSTFNGAVTINSGGTLNGTFAGNPSFSGTDSFNITNHSGLATFSAGLKTDAITGITPNGGSLTIFGAPGTSGAGQILNMRAGNGFTNFAGGEAQFFAGNGGSGGTGGRMWIQSGTGGAGNSSGGPLQLFAGGGAGSGTGGSEAITAGPGGATGNGGAVSISAGLSGATSGNGGAMTINGGSNNVASVGGDGGGVTIFGGNGGIITPGTGGSIFLTPGSGMTANGTVKVNVGVGQGTGIKHTRVTTGVLGAGTWTEVLITWGGTAFANTRYTATCSVEEAVTADNAQGLVFERIRTRSTTQIGGVIQNPTGGDLTGTLDCMAMADGN